MADRLTLPPVEKFETIERDPDADRQRTHPQLKE